MTHPEHQPASAAPEPQLPGTLPPELVAYLKDKDYTALLHETNYGTVFVIKLPVLEIDSVRGRIPIRLQSELYDHPAAPVVRTSLRIYDRSRSPLVLETFTNVADEQQRRQFALLASLEYTHLLFYDENLALRLFKQLRSPESDTITRILIDADELRAAIPDHAYDFDVAKAAVIAATTI